MDREFIGGLAGASQRWWLSMVLVTPQISWHSAGWNLTVFPIYSIFMFCNIAPWADIPIRVSAVVMLSKPSLPIGIFHSIIRMLKGLIPKKTRFPCILGGLVLSATIVSPICCIAFGENGLAAAAQRQPGEGQDGGEGGRLHRQRPPGRTALAGGSPGSPGVADGREERKVREAEALQHVSCKCAPARCRVADEGSYYQPCDRKG